MKKNILLILLILVAIFLNINVKAISCTYSSDYYEVLKGVKDKIKKVTFEIDEQFQLQVIPELIINSNGNGNKDTLCDTCYLSTELSVNDFLEGEDDNKKWYCPILYFSVDINWSYEGRHNVNITKKNKNKTNELKLIEEQLDSNPIEETVQKNGWENVCTYGSTILYIGNATYEIYPKFSNLQYRLTMQDLINIGYQCPNYMCTDEIVGISVEFFEEKTLNYTCIEGISVIDGCIQYNKLIQSYTNNINLYNNTSDKKLKMSYKNKYIQDIEKIKDYCSIQFSYKEYDDICLKSCLDFYQINLKSDDLDECGFSSKLIIYIANIVRWVKYIIPVLVIGLGILDFIKAMSQDKEDEMKKAQKRFIIRLISAALIFIVPFILEFVLNKMGFAANGCGIIDL